MSAGILNVDHEHPDNDAFPRPGFRTEFLQKWLREPPAGAVLGEGGGEQSERQPLKESSDAAQRWAPLSRRAFCDPRDM